MRQSSLRPTAWPRSPRYPYVSGGLLALLAAAEVLNGRITSATVLATLPFVVLPLLWRRLEPRTGLLVVPAALLNFLFRPELLLAVAVAGVMGLYTLARHRVLHPALLITAGITGSVLVNVGHVVTGVYDLGGRAPAVGADGSMSYFTESFVLAVGVVATVGVADAFRSREETLQAREAAQRELIAMERRHAAAAERAAIARELHDVVAHAVSVIAVQAESATYTTPDLSPAAREGFQQIAGSARSAMAELRQLLSVLRANDPGGEESAPIAPQPTLDSLDALLDAHRSGGGEVELHTEGTRPAALPPSVELTVYRIVQEALTNARRHAPGAKVRVRLEFSPSQVRLRVVDDGPGPDPEPKPAEPGSGGHGLSGMRERASLLGGRLTCGAAGPGGGFLVDAELPARASARSLAEGVGE
ncbi:MULTISPECIES: sensor histidine kinase [unclassified Streptomyces]|uniref:sensor histidine kinase n=1 Tax=unclassified Streptomyces TaxID=2593676 RepID=UPI002365424C|nr:MULTISPECIES: sensor histidine kinase [unclassified Streptomyces]MDF3144080.1 sensor histidine kinase [Streptomyces sp. T21Q-yed]WDF39813.1 sensor histidine kinase [Streptomyces sp. T12]